jgi:hypothetical protein
MFSSRTSLKGLGLLFATVAWSAAGCAASSSSAKSPPALKEVDWIKGKEGQEKLGQALDAIRAGQTDCRRFVAEYRGRNASGDMIQVAIVKGRGVARKLKRGRTVRRYDSELASGECSRLVMLAMAGKLWKAPPREKLQKAPTRLVIGVEGVGKLAVPLSSSKVWRQQSIDGLRQQLLAIGERIMAAKNR